MMTKDYFVIIHHPNGRVYPLIEDDDNMAMFKTASDANVAGYENDLAATYGFEIFELGNGELTI